MFLICDTSKPWLHQKEPWQTYCQRYFFWLFIFRPLKYKWTKYDNFSFQNCSYKTLLSLSIQSKTFKKCLRRLSLCFCHSDQAMLGTKNFQETAFEFWKRFFEEQIHLIIYKSFIDFTPFWENADWSKVCLIGVAIFLKAGLT